MAAHASQVPLTAPAPTGLSKAAQAPAVGGGASTAPGAAHFTPFQAPPTDARIDLESGQHFGVIDKEIFGQLLEMDDNDEHNFSKPLAEEYIEQAHLTLRQIDAALVSQESKRDMLDTLSGRGHFLKGSSAALGLLKVRESCEKMQNFGKCKTAAGEGHLTEEEALSCCRSLLPQLKNEQAEATWWLQKLCNIDA